MDMLYFLPWWAKIIMICIVFGIVGNITMHIIGSIDKKTITERMHSNPALALQIAIENRESAVFTPEEYESQLLYIVHNTGYDKAMAKLAKFYSGEKEGDKKDIEKFRYWLERAAKAGNLESIADYYGFSNYDVESDAYEEIMNDLDNVKAGSEDEVHIVCYLKSIVYYKIGNTEMAKRMLEGLDYPKLEDKRRHMLFLCYAKESDMEAAENILQQMEQNGFIVPADFYLTIYQYYALSKEDKVPDYISQIKYTEKYIASKEVNEEVARKIGSDAYYHLGEEYWVGKEFRHYRKANEYLLKAANKGHVRAKEMLEKFGVDGILVLPMQANMVTYQFIGNYEFRASENTMKWLQLYYGIQYKVGLIADEFKNQYTTKFRSFDMLINGVQQLYTEHIVQMVRWCVLMLLSFGIDSYDAGDIVESCGDLSLLPRIPMFEQGIEKIDYRAEQLKIQTAYTKATRGYWSGAGFGSTIHGTIGASIKASAAAGIMNVGSKALHGIGDSIARSIDNAEINRMKNELFGNPQIINEFVNAIYTACFSVGQTTRKIIEVNSVIRLEALEGIVQYGGEDLSNITDKTLTAKINNYLYLEDKRAYVLLLEKLRRNPLDEKVFHQLYEYADNHVASLEDKEILTSMKRYGYDFGILE